MDIEKLIETLRQRGVAYVRAYGRYCSICDEVVTALSTLQAELEFMTNRNNENFSMCKIWKRRYSKLQAENKRLRAELEQKSKLIAQQAVE